MTPPFVRKRGGTKESILMKVKVDSEKSGLELNIQKTKVIASSPITSCWIERHTVETLTDFTFLNSRITPDAECSHGIQGHLLLGRKATTNPESTLKSRDINLPTKVHPVKAMAFPTVMDGCENWTIKELSANELMLLNCGVGQDSWESPGFPEHQPVDPKENQSWIFIGRTDAEAPTVWLHDVKNWCTGKDANPGKDWRQE